MSGDRIDIARGLLGALAVAVLALSQPAARAQDGDGLTIKEALAFCAQLSGDGERLACFEALAETANPDNQPDDGHERQAAKNLEQQSPSPAPAADDLAQSPKETAQSTTAKAEDKAKQETSKKRRWSFLPFIGGKKKAESPEIKPVENATGGEERFIIKRADDPDIQRERRVAHKVEVYKSWRNSMGELRVAFKHGEIWVQMDGSSIEYDPQPGEIAEFKPMSFGSWLVHFESGKRGVAMRKAN